MAQVHRLPGRGGERGPDEVLGLADLRLLRRAIHRDPQALTSLWARVVDDAWSIARALVDEDSALSALAVAREALVVGAPGLSMDARWVELPYGELYAELRERLGLPGTGTLDLSALQDIEPPESPLALNKDSEEARRAVQCLPPALRLIYLFTLLTPCRLDGIARFAGAPPSVVRQARTAATWHVLRELQK